LYQHTLYSHAHTHRVTIGAIPSIARFTDAGDIIPLIHTLGIFVAA